MSTLIRRSLNFHVFHHPPLTVSGWGGGVERERGGGRRKDAPWQQNRISGFQNSNLAITRRPDGPRSSRFQLSAYFYTLFLVRWVSGLNSFNLNDFIILGVGFEVGRGSSLEAGAVAQQDLIPSVVG